MREPYISPFAYEIYDFSYKPYGKFHVLYLSLSELLYV